MVEASLRESLRVPERRVKIGPIEKVKQQKQLEEVSKKLEEEMENLRNAIELRKRRQQHSDFYHRLSELTQRIYVYKKLFLERAPKFMQNIKRMNITNIKDVDKDFSFDDKARSTSNQRQKGTEGLEGILKVPGKQNNLHLSPTPNGRSRGGRQSFKANGGGNTPRKSMAVMNRVRKLQFLSE